MPTPADAVAVILVDDADRPLGLCDKLEAHRRGLLHRAVSLFAYDEAGRLLVQQRAPGKYHSGGLWSNTACTHPREGETLEAAVQRGLREELGIEADDLRHVFPFTYRAEVGGGLVEHEYDHVFVSRVRGTPRAVPGEVEAFAFEDPAGLLADVTARPARFTPWFRLLLPRIAAWERGALDIRST